MTSELERGEIEFNIFRGERVGNLSIGFQSLPASSASRPSPRSQLRLSVSTPRRRPRSRASLFSIFFCSRPRDAFPARFDARATVQSLVSHAVLRRAVQRCIWLTFLFSLVQLEFKSLNPALSPSNRLAMISASKQKRLAEKVRPLAAFSVRARRLIERIFPPRPGRQARRQGWIRRLEQSRFEGRHAPHERLRRQLSRRFDHGQTPSRHRSFRKRCPHLRRPGS